MSVFPIKNDVINAVIAGIENAKRNYTFWTSDELYLSYAPPKFLTIHVAQEIGKLANAPEIFIDATISDILRCSLPNRTDFRDFMKKNYIMDRLLCLTLDERFTHKSDNDSVSRVIMSLKNGVRNVQEEYKNDVELMCKMLQRDKKEDSTLDYGIFAFYLDISSSARKNAQERLDNIIESFDSIVASHKNLKSSFKGGSIKKIEKVGEWCIGCYVIEHTL
ncbi:hypothetical protein AACT_2635 [Arcobacter acticola]|jgi:hypothetical protein|uniref:Uncharacterized protein n=1 Tax=Arcobacter acticola TaxID=1849015 RepID=A0A6M8EYT3_9BACT|nr:hypothetical protein [Arcobacter acticola]QKE29707.1 hypothetical protein AACT_2635 [Arcobacter acticola]